MLREEGVWQQSYNGVNRKKSEKKPQNTEPRLYMAFLLLQVMKEWQNVKREWRWQNGGAGSAPCRCHASWPRALTMQSQSCSAPPGGFPSHLLYWLSWSFHCCFTLLPNVDGCSRKVVSLVYTTALNARGWWHPFRMPGDILVHCRTLDEMTSKDPFQLRWSYDSMKCSRFCQDGIWRRFLFWYNEVEMPLVIAFLVGGISC